MKRPRLISITGILLALAAVMAGAGNLPTITEPHWLVARYLPYQQAVILRWSPIPGATGYKVLRSEGRGANALTREIAPAGFAGTRWVDRQDLQPGTQYHYAFQAVVGSQTRQGRAEDQVFLPGNPVAPPSAASGFGPPQWEPPTPVILPSPDKPGLNVFLYWCEVPGAANYKLFRSKVPGQDFELLATVDATDHVDFVAREDKSIYYYALKAVDKSGLETAFSEERYGDFRGGHPQRQKNEEWYRASGGACADCHIPHKASGSRDLMMNVVSARKEPLAGAPPPPDFGKTHKKMAVGGFSGWSSAQDQDGGAPARPTYEGFGQTFDEVWVIERGHRPQPPPPDDDTPGCGELRAEIGGRTVPFPLRHTDVRATVTGYIASVTVTQKYQNPYSEKIEAVYVFPLPENAAVSDFVMRIGERRIRGIIREREEAMAIYQEARRQGYVASLLTQERPNVFTQKVANIEPGRDIDIDISYFNTLGYEDGIYSFVFPMVVGPRYNPADSTDGVGAVARGATGVSGQSTEVQYLRPGERSGHDISLTLDLDAGVPLEEVQSPSHAVDVERRGKSAARVSLKPSDSLPNKDFVLRFTVAGKTVQSALMVERGKEGGWFTLMLQPPKNLADLPRTGQEIVFLLDTSGSMQGWPIEKAKAATRRALRLLRPEDTFQIVRFAGDCTQFAPFPVPATPENVDSGLRYLDTLSGGGGTEMVRGIAAALDFPHDERRFRVVCFLTDGYIGNEEQVLRAVADKLGPSRVFSFGVGSSVNRYLMEGLARIGRGAVAYILTGDSDTAAVDKFFERINHLALTDISVDWGGMEVTDIFPKRVPDLFIGRPVLLTGRFTGHGEATVRLSGRCGGERQTVTVQAPLDDPEAHQRGISRIWARARIADLSDAMTVAGRADLKEKITRTALDYGLVSAYTAFVAVDSTQVTGEDHGVTVTQPVPMPEGVRYDTTVQE